MVDCSAFQHDGLAPTRSSVDSASFKIHILQRNKTIDKWPVLLWFYLKTLGLYHSGRLVCSKLCAKCQRKNKPNTLCYTEEMCKVCDSLMWDHRGVRLEITDHDIGSSFFNHMGSGLLSLLWLLIITGTTVASIVLVISDLNHGQHDVVHVMAWTGMKLLLYIGPFACLTSVIHHFSPTILLGSWANALAVEFLIHRLRIVNMAHKKCAGYACFLGSLTIIASECIKIAVSHTDPDLVSPVMVHEIKSGASKIIPLHLFVIIEGFTNFGGFCFLVYLLRSSYESEIRLVIKFLHHNIEDTDLCRSRLAEAFDAHHTFREFASGWIAMNLLLCTVCLLLELHLWIINTELTIFQYEHAFILIVVLIAPIVSLGNVDVDYLWNRLVRQVSRQRTTQQEQQWDKLMQFLQEQRAGSRPWQAVLAFFLSTIAIFSAIQFHLLSHNH